MSVWSEAVSFGLKKCALPAKTLHYLVFHLLIALPPAPVLLYDFVFFQESKKGIILAVGAQPKQRYLAV